MCEQLAQGCYPPVHWAGVELGTSGLQVRHANVTAPSHNPLIQLSLSNVGRMASLKDASC